MTDFDVSAIPTGTNDDINMVISRSTLVAVYTYGVTAAPLVFAIVIGQLMLALVSKRYVEIATLYAGLAAAGLTVLPLRAALIPSDVPQTSLTRVDLILAYQLGLLAKLAGIAAFAHWRWLRQRATL
jgi:hypothetical protein